MKLLSKTGALTALLSSALVLGLSGQSIAADKIQLRLASSGSDSGTRAVAMEEVFGPAVSKFASFEPHWNSTLFKQGTELEAIARGNLEMALASAQELAVFFPEYSIFSAGYVHRDAEHQKAVFNDPLMDSFKKKFEDVLNIKLLAVTYFGSRQVNLRQPKSELTVSTPADLAGVNLRMPGTAAWQFLGNALGANATPLAFSEVYTSLASGAVDGQDNPLPTVVDKKLYEVTKQIILTSHLADLNYIAISKSVWDDMTYDQKRAVHNAAEAAADHSTAAVQAKEASLVSFLESEGLDVYEPDLDAFRNHVQGLYMDSEFAKTWPEGLLDKINAL
ncbi:MAG: TRAP transporter substrate-binding protein DctP [Candidatus Thioglobus sp.]|nr:TRAP transporter substrate-binding protein DctP [Candidatus Thioglobus sp.]